MKNIRKTNGVQSLRSAAAAAGAGPYISVTFHGCHSRDTLNATFPATHTHIQPRAVRRSENPGGGNVLIWWA